MPRKPVKRSCNPSQISTLERSEIVGYQGRIVSRLVLSSDGKLRAWMARLAGSDLPKGKECQPTFALMAQTTCLDSLSACTRYWPATQRRDRPSLFTGPSSFSLQCCIEVVGLAAEDLLGMAKSAVVHWVVVIKFSNHHAGRTGTRTTGPPTRPRAGPQQTHPSILPAQSGFRGQFAAIALHSPSLQSPEKGTWPYDTTKPSHPSPADLTCSAADPSSHRSTSQLRSPPQIASTLALDCPAGAITARMGRVESAVGPKSYKHRDDLKLPASASQDPGAQLTSQIADCRLQMALAPPPPPPPPPPRFTHR